MKTFLKIIWRFIKVVYVVLLLVGLFVVYNIWTENQPEPYHSYSYKVTCNNGKSFDPTSKPIEVINKDEINNNFLSLSKDNILDETEKKFNTIELNSECEHGNAFYYLWQYQPPTTPEYNIVTTKYDHITKTQTDQILDTVIIFILYYLFLEILRRIFLYIFLGKNFITLKNSNNLNKQNKDHDKNI